MKHRALWVLAATVLTVALTARLGFWQLDRAAQKVALQQAREQRGALPPVTAAELPQATAAAADAEPLWHRRVALQGRWVADETVYLDNRPMAGRTGFFVVTPLRLADGRALLVQRGWLPRHAAERSRIAPYRSDAGEVTVQGRLAPTPSRLYELGEAASGVIRQNLDIADRARETGRTLLPLVVVQDGAPPDVDDGLVRQWPQPASDVHKHYGYAFQWFGLSGLALALYVWFQLIRPRRRTRLSRSR